MKSLLFIIIFYLLNFNNTEIIGKYQIESKDSFDRLMLNNDGTYLYESRGSSCWIWFDISGSWTLKGNKLTLLHNHTYEEETVICIEKKDKKSKNNVTIDIKDTSGKPISDFEVTYSSNSIEQTKNTNKNGIVVFNNYGNKNSDNELASIQINHKINGNQSSQNNSVYKSSNKISIVINNQPKTIEERKKYIFIIKDKTLTSFNFPYTEKGTKYNKL